MEILEPLRMQENWRSHYQQYTSLTLSIFHPQHKQIFFIMFAGNTRDIIWINLHYKGDNSAQHKFSWFSSVPLS
jgi:hypothetical protein